MRGLVSALSWAACAGVAFAATLDASLIQTSGEPSVGSGKFYGYRTATNGPGDDALARACAKAVSEGVPLVLVWSNEGCEHCAGFIDELNGRKAEVSAWLKSHKAVFAFFKDSVDDDVVTDEWWQYNHGFSQEEPKNIRHKACYDAWVFADDCGAEAPWPLMAFYYMRPDGKEVLWGAKDDYDGHTRTWDNLAGWYEEWLSDNGIDPDYRGGEFAASGTEFDRYEAVAGTEYVDVELVRGEDGAAYAAANTLRATWPDGGGTWETNVAWSVGEAAKTVRVPVRPGAEDPFREGEISLVLLNAAGSEISSVPVVCTGEVANSNVNPLWIGERTPEGLGWGEWTMDLSAATAKVAAAEGAAYTLVSVQGSLWCPDCANCDRNFLDLEDEGGTNRFRAWAAERHVALAVVDIPNYNGQTAEDYATPSLLSRRAFATATARTSELERSGADAALTNKLLRSGRPYLSRKMASAAEAEEIRLRNHFLAWAYTQDGGYLRPEDGEKARVGGRRDRTGVPIFVLLRKDGTVAGRMTRFSSVAPMKDERGKWSDYIRRFDEMLELADEPDEVENGHWTTTAAAVSSAARVEASLSHVDCYDVARISDASVGAHVRLSLSGESSSPVTLEIMSVSNGVLRTLASAYGPLDGLATEAYLISAADGWFASVSCKNTAAGFEVGSQSSTVARYALAEECYILPQEKAGVNVPGGGTAVFRVEAGEEYRFAGLDLPVEGVMESAGAEDRYVAKVSGNVELRLADGAESVVYQVWHPGEVAFSRGVQDAYTHMREAQISVVRTGGVSGRRAETVRLVEADKYAGGRFEWTDAEVVWEDGEAGPRTVSLKLVPPEAGLSPVGELVFGVCESRLSVLLYDTDSPGLAASECEAAAYRNFSSCLAFGTVNVLSGEFVSARVVSGQVPPGTRVVYDEASKEVRLVGEPSKAGEYEFSVALSEIRGGECAVGPASAVRVSVADPVGINPFLAEARRNEVLPLLADLDGRDAVAGTLSVAVTSRGKISAKYAGTEARTVAFSGSWQELDEDDGTAYAELESAGCTLWLAMDAEGAVSAELWVPEGMSYFANGRGGVVMYAESDWPAEQLPLSEYAGQYNVVVPSGDASRPDAPSGTGIFALRMAAGSAAARAGRFSYSGYMADGTPVSGSVEAMRDSYQGGDFARLPVFARIGRSFFSAQLAVDPDAYLNWDNPTNPLAREVVRLAPAAAAMTVHRDSSWEWALAHDKAIGSYYVPGASPMALSVMFYAGLERLDPTLHRLEFAMEGAESPVFGLPSVPSEDVCPTRDSMTNVTKAAGVSFKFSPRTGMFAGAVVMTFTDGDGARRRATGLYRGVLTPGWIRNCECGSNVPEWFFGSGSMRYRDFNADGRAVMKSVPLVMDPVEIRVNSN